MNNNLPTGFHAQVLALAFPPEHTFKIALYDEHQDLAIYDTSGECDGEGYIAGGATLTGYALRDHGTHAIISFDRLIDWFNATIISKSAVVYDADTGVVMNIMNFERQVGVVGGVFSLSLNQRGVVVLGEVGEP